MTQTPSFYMDDPTLSWFQWMERNNMLRTWPEFLHSLETRFAPSHFHNIKGRLCKLSQTNYVLQYLTKFESLSNRITDVPPLFMLECFISGLRLDIQREVLAFQPVTFSEAVELAKLQEDKFGYSPTPSKTLSTSTFTTTHTPLLPTPSSLALPYKCLSASDMQARCDKGLCYNCDDKYSPDHHCKSHFFLLIHDDEEQPISETSPPESLKPDATGSAQLSLTALSGHFTQRCFMSRVIF